MSQAPLRDVADTARWVAYFRALESDRGDALFKDPYARRMAGERGRAIAEGLPKGPLSWSLAVRTRVFDELILETIQRNQIGTVLNVAAGFDARPYRMPLPSGLQWIEVDLPDIIEAKTTVLDREKATCKVDRISLDLANPHARQAMLARIQRESTSILVVTEGLLVYLDDAKVAAVTDDLLRFFPGGLWLMENVAPNVLERQRRMWSKTLRPANAEMKFAPEAGLAFFRQHGWSPRITRSLLDEAQRLGREMPLVSIIRSVASFIPPIGRAYARRQESLRNAVVYAVLEASDQT